jgi:hypothetical protein
VCLERTIKTNLAKAQDLLDDLVELLLACRHVELQLGVHPVHTDHLVVAANCVVISHVRGATPQGEGSLVRLVDDGIVLHEHEDDKGEEEDDEEVCQPVHSS